MKHDYVVAEESEPNEHNTEEIQQYIDNHNPSDHQGTTA